MNDQITKNQHAYLVVGEIDSSVKEIKQVVGENFGVELNANPDYRESHFETLGIDEARELKDEQSRRPFGGSEKFFVIVADALTREAQNALLKVFEEPTEGTYIFLIVRNARQILPTLLSRVRVIKASSHKLQVVSSADTAEFLAASVEKRLQLPFIKKLLENKEKQAVISFFDELESRAHEELIDDKSSAIMDFLDELIKSRGYAGDRSSSVKMILEHVALTAPQIIK